MGSRRHLSKPWLPLALVVGTLVVGGLSSVASGALTMTATRAGSAPTGKSASCSRGFKPAIIAGKFKCLKSGQKCAKRNQKAYRKYGLSCVNGHLRKGAPPPAPPPAPPAPPPAPPPLPTPPAQPGHYKGLSSQLTNFEFDVTPDGNFVHTPRHRTDQRGVLAPWPPLRRRPELRDGDDSDCRRRKLHDRSSLPRRGRPGSLDRPPYDHRPPLGGHGDRDFVGHR